MNSTFFARSHNDGINSNVRHRGDETSTPIPQSFIYVSSTQVECMLLFDYDIYRIFFNWEQEKRGADRACVCAKGRGTRLVMRRRCIEGNLITHDLDRAKVVDVRGALSPGFVDPKECMEDYLGTEVK